MPKRSISPLEPSCQRIRRVAHRRFQGRLTGRGFMRWSALHTSSTSLETVHPSHSIRALTSESYPVDHLLHVPRIRPTRVCASHAIRVIGDFRADDKPPFSEGVPVSVPTV